MSETLEALRIRAHELELEAVAIRARHAEVISLIAILEHAAAAAPKRGRPPAKPALGLVAGGDDTDTAA